MVKLKTQTIFRHLYSEALLPQMCYMATKILHSLLNLPNCRHVGVVVRAYASQSVDYGFIPLVESYQKTLKSGIHSFPAWRSAFMGDCAEQAGKFACCVLGQGTYLTGRTRLYVKDRWPRHLGNGNSQASVHFPSKI